ncbi:MAG: hypothetical protein EBT36_14475, partial [Betaproteobacteria bacterium]|nr:hypothetical protein [Betaproteobacteria bacterium]
PQAALSVSRIDRSVLQFEDDAFAWMAPDDGPWEEPYFYPDPELAAASPPIQGHVEKPTIFVDPGLLPSIVKQSCALLDAVVYKRGVQLVRIGRGAELADGLMRVGSQPVLLPVARQWIIRELTEKASFQRWDKRSTGQCALFAHRWVRGRYTWLRLSDGPLLCTDLKLCPFIGKP